MSNNTVWHYAICYDVGVGRATMLEVLTPEEMHDKLGDLGDNHHVLAVVPGTHSAGQRLRAHVSDFIADVSAHLNR